MVRTIRFPFKVFNEKLDFICTSNTVCCLAKNNEFFEFICFKKMIVSNRDVVETRP